MRLFILGRFIFSGSNTSSNTQLNKGLGSLENVVDLSAAISSSPYLQQVASGELLTVLTAATGDAAPSAHGSHPHPHPTGEGVGYPSHPVGEASPMHGLHPVNEGLNYATHPSGSYPAQPVGEGVSYPVSHPMGESAGVGVAASYLGHPPYSHPHPATTGVESPQHPPQSPPISPHSTEPPPPPPPTYEQHLRQRLEHLNIAPPPDVTQHVDAPSTTTHAQNPAAILHRPFTGTNNSALDAHVPRGQSNHSHAHVTQNVSDADAFSRRTFVTHEALLEWGTEPPSGALGGGVGVTPGGGGSNPPLSPISESSSGVGGNNLSGGNTRSVSAAVSDESVAGDSGVFEVSIKR